MYEYVTPYGAGDTFFQYVFDAQTADLTDGQTYMQKGVPVNNGQFVLRYWSGLKTIADRLQIYDWLGRRFYQDAVFLGAASTQPSGQLVVLPEVVFPENGNIRIDLHNVVQSVISDDVLSSQLVFSGVRRRAGVVGDPQPSAYKYYEKEFSMPFEFTVEDTATATNLDNFTQYTVPVEDFDFELRRVELYGETESDSLFKILMYDQNWVQMSNAPVLSKQFFHLDPRIWPELNFWPCPPVLYRVDSVIRFNIYSLITPGSGLGDRTYRALFKGVRRIPCQ